MFIEFAPRNKRIISRIDIVDIPEIKTKNLTVAECDSCYNTAASLCKKGERVFGWKVLDTYELDKEAKQYVRNI
jgi:hypothetical protein